MKRLLIPFACIMLAFFSCKSSGEKKTDTAISTSADQAEKPSSTRILNNIQLVSTGGVEVTQAYLHLENGLLVPETNEVPVNEKVKMKLIIKGGWHEENGKVKLGASEKITTSNNDLVLDAPDLFGDTELSAEDAHVITLSAVITRIEKQTDHFNVSFKVWDKNGSGEISGNYKLYVK